MDSDTSPYIDALYNFKNACYTYYRVIKFVCGIFEGSAWDRKIKDKLFQVRMSKSYYKDLNEENWIFIQAETLNRYREIPLQITKDFIKAHLQARKAIN